MTPNHSTAVMQRRAATPADALDYFPTPPWATRALCEQLLAMGEPIGQQRVWEPACGEMHMARPLAEYFGHVTATDVYRYSDDHGICDFLDHHATAPRPPVEWIITNPPFKVAAQFIHRARAVALRGVAMLVRGAFTESEGRWETLFGGPDLPSWEWQFAERVVMLKGRLIRTGAPDPFNLDAHGDPAKASTATSYTWLVWQPGQNDWRKRIIAPCRLQLERASDYPVYLDQWFEAGRRKQAAIQQGGLL